MAKVDGHEGGAQSPAKEVWGRPNPIPAPRLLLRMILIVHAGIAYKVYETWVSTYCNTRKCIQHVIPINTFINFPPRYLTLLARKGAVLFAPKRDAVVSSALFVVGELQEAMQGQLA